jgi:hypothetical protein
VSVSNLRPPFAPGNGVALRHGSYAVLRLKPRAEEIAEVLRDVVVEGDRFPAAIESAAMIGARVEAAFAALSDAKPNELRRLDQDARGWARLWLQALAALGLTPAARARILRDAGVGKAAATSAALRELRDHVERTYGDEVEA